MRRIDVDIITTMIYILPEIGINMIVLGEFCHNCNHRHLQKKN